MSELGSTNTKAVLYFSNHLRGPKGAAGARTWHQVKCLSKEYSVTVIIPAIDPVTAKPVTEESYEGLDFESVDVIRIRTAKNDRGSLHGRAKYYLSAVLGQLRAGLSRKQINVVISMGLPVTMLLVAWLVSIRHRAKFVVDVRDLPFETALEIGYINAEWLFKVARLIENFLLRKADHVLTNSPRYQPELITKGVPASRITVAYIGYDNFYESSHSMIEEWRARLVAELHPKTHVIGVYTGTIGHAFPVETILEGALKLRDDPTKGFVFLGDGQKFEKFKSLSQEQSLNATFLGRVPKSDVEKICRAADYCIYPSLSGKFSAAILGNKVFDYLGARKPILYIGNDSAVRDLLQQLGAALYSGPNAPEKFADNVRLLTEDKSLYNQLSSNAHNGLITGPYTAQQSAKLLLQLLKSFN